MKYLGVKAVIKRWNYKMEKLNQKIVSQHDREREEMTDQLNRGRREINANLNELEGWADRIMGAILKPAGSDAVLWFDSFKSKSGNGAPYKREQ